MARRHVVVVGGGFGGLAAVRGLAGADVDITLVDKRNHHLFQPLLYQVATAGLAPSDIAEPLRGILRRQANVEVRLGEVRGVDVASRTVTLADGHLSYDVLVLAAGARTSYFGHDDWAAHAPGLKTIGDALAIRHKMLEAFEAAEWAVSDAERDRMLTFVVVGAGPTGVELAGALREIACHTVRRDFRHVDTQSARVMLVEAAPSVLTPFPADLQASARAQLESLGVEVLTGRKVESVEDGALVIDGERIEAGTIIWGAGVRASPLGASLGAEVDRGGRVLVGPDLSVPGHAEVFVIGDLAHAKGADGKPLPGLAPVAIQQGEYVARVVRAPETARTPFRYTDYGTMATIGRSRAVAVVFGQHVSGTLAWLMWVFVHLMTLVGHRNRVVVFVKWAWAWLTFEQSSRLLWRGEPDAGHAETAARASSS